MWNKSRYNRRIYRNISTIKQTIDTWYENNLLTSYDKYISKTAIYCNDRSVGKGTYSISKAFYFGAYTRLYTNDKPTYKCGGNITGGLFSTGGATEDKFSASTEGGGNGQLTYPIALMTADEVAFAGGKYDKSLSSPYAWYYTNSIGESVTGTSLWWTISTYWWNYGITNVFSSDGSDYPGRLKSYYVHWSHAARPSVSLKSCVLVSDGNGTSSNPYIVTVDDTFEYAEN